MLKDRGIILHRQENTGTKLCLHDGDVPFFSFPGLDRLPVMNGISTRLGGVSKGYFAEMNTQVKKEDPEIIDENYRRLSEVMKFDRKRVVLTSQRHTVNIRTVTEADAGKGLIFPRDYDSIDGLITNVSGLPLVAFFADCVPLLFVDPVNRAIGLSHAGWRGTVNGMAKETVNSMHAAFGTDPEDLYVGIGPSICQDCYEVSEDVGEAFRETFGIFRFPEIARPGLPGKYQLDLRRANELMLLSAGVLKERIEITDLCTKCNPGVFYSHRVSGDKRGLQSAFLMLKE